MDYRTLQRNRFTPYPTISPHSTLRNTYLDHNPKFFVNGDIASRAYPARHPRQDQFWDFGAPLPHHAHLQPALAQVFSDYYNPREYDQYTAQQAFVRGSSSAATSRPSWTPLPSPNPFALRQASWTPDSYGSYFAEEHVPEQFDPPPSTDAHSGVPDQIIPPTVPELPEMPWSSPKQDVRLDEEQGIYSFVLHDPYRLRTTRKKAANSTGNPAAKKRPHKKQAVAVGPATMASSSSHVGTAAHLSPIREDAQDLATHPSPGGPTNGNAPRDPAREPSPDHM
ncbi:hypothetical protein BC629DRAFT_528331 [Irpex lacteus]|nr:hypothetical protein BC629DRAFT_528331 [Irpex lacteus]